ncbi:hypothetical protein G7046_g5571 [Stylonectria norvegica]|nr:hypothetical protein G7046_g5571 [Stylonectria norvegica]
MNPLGGIALFEGLLAEAAQAVNLLGLHDSTLDDTPAIGVARLINAEVQGILPTLGALKSLLMSAPSNRAALVQVNQVIAILADGVEMTLQSLPLPTPSMTPMLLLQARVQWASKTNNLQALFTRLQGLGSSVRLILSILQSNSVAPDAKDTRQSAANVDVVLEENKAFLRRLMNLESASDESSTELSETLEPVQIPDALTAVPTSTSRSVAVSSTMAVSSFQYQTDLKASRAYRRARPESSVMSAGVSIATWSVFSGLSLGDTSIMPGVRSSVHPDDLINPQQYDFSNSIQRNLAQPQQGQFSRSIFHDCLEVKELLLQIHGFAPVFEWQTKIDGSHGNPLRELRGVFARGFPLLMLLNQWEYRWDIPDYRIDQSEKEVKRAIYDFLQVCSRSFGIKATDLFTVTDLMEDNDIGLLKLVSILLFILARLIGTGIIKAVDVASLLPSRHFESASITGFWVTIEDFLVLERTYLNDLLQLMDLKLQIEAADILFGDELYQIFALVPRLVQVEVRFLYELEITAMRPLEQQRWAGPFRTLEDATELYASFISSEKRYKGILRSRQEKLQSRDALWQRELLESCERLISAPSIRLMMYSNFSQTINYHGGRVATELGREIQLEAPTVRSIVRAALKRANDAIKAEELIEATIDLKKRLVAANRTNPWKSMLPGFSGSLLLFEQNLKIVSGRSAIEHDMDLWVKEIKALQERNRPATPAAPPTPKSVPEYTAPAWTKKKNPY